MCHSTSNIKSRILDRTHIVCIIYLSIYLSICIPWMHWHWRATMRFIMNSFLAQIHWLIGAPHFVHGSYQISARCTPPLKLSSNNRQYECRVTLSRFYHSLCVCLYFSSFRSEKTHTQFSWWITEYRLLWLGFYGRIFVLNAEESWCRCRCRWRWRWLFVRCGFINISYVSTFSVFGVLFDSWPPSEESKGNNNSNSKKPNASTWARKSCKPS